ncbi:hypothetical protein PENTCL1PPCAC_24702, partial [Pristionchus entomophagus]
MDSAALPLATSTLLPVVDWELFPLVPMVDVRVVSLALHPITAVNVPLEELPEDASIITRQDSGARPMATAAPPVPIMSSPSEHAKMGSVAMEKRAEQTISVANLP